MSFRIAYYKVNHPLGLIATLGTKVEDFDAKHHDSWYRQSPCLSPVGA